MDTCLMGVFTYFFFVQQNGTFMAQQLVLNMHMLINVLFNHLINIFNRIQQPTGQLTEIFSVKPTVPLQFKIKTKI